MLPFYVLAAVALLAFVCVWAALRVALLAMRSREV